MALGIGMRTLWISLRAINYSDRAFRAAIGNTDALSKAEKDRLDILKAQRTEITANIQTGMLYIAMGYMAASAIGNIVKSTQLGAVAMQQFNQNIQDAKVALADTFFVILKPIIEVLNIFLNLIKNNTAFRYFVATAMLGGTVILLLGGALKVLTGMLDLNNNKLAINTLMHRTTTTAAATHTVTIHGMKMAYWQLALAIGAAFATFAIVYTLLERLNNPVVNAIALLGGLALAMWSLFVASSAALGPLAPFRVAIGLAAAGVAAAGALALMGQMSQTKMQHGTRSLPFTGTFFGHQGEVVYNPHTDRPTGVMETQPTTTTTIYDVPVRIENVHTKADFDDFGEQMGQVLRTASRRRR